MSGTWALSLVREANTPRVLFSKGAGCRRKMASEVTQVAMGVGAHLGCMEHRFIAYRALADAQSS